MRFQLIKFFLLFLLTNLLNAQETFIVEYEHLLNDNKDKYGSNWKIYERLITNNIESESFVKSIDTIFKGFGDNNNLAQNQSEYTLANFKDVKKRIFYSNTRYEKYNLADSTYKINWEIIPQSKKVLGYDCQAAKGHLRGRDYIVYFTSEIPIKNGPFKFDGLPGLILEVFSEDKCVFFKAKSISKTDEKIENIFLDKTLISWKILSKNYKLLFDKMENYKPEEGVSYNIPNRTVEYLFEPYK